MKRLAGIVMAIAALTVCLLGAGCSQPAATAENAITVSASGTAKIAPDSANIGIVATSRGATVEEARANAARTAADVTARLKTAGADENLISIAEGDLVPVYGGVVEEQVMDGYYDYDGNWIETGPYTIYHDLSDEIVAYDATSTVTANHVAVASLPTMLKESVAAGAVGFQNFTYFISDRQAAYQAALAAAVDAAKAKAEALAQASGVYVGRVVNMEELSDPAALVLEVAGDTAGLDAQDTSTLNVEPAEIPVDASVTVSYAIS